MKEMVWLRHIADGIDLRSHGQRLHADVHHGVLAVAAALLAVAGVQSWRSLPIDAFPDVSPTQVKIILKAPGMTPEEVEARIVAPIELEMLGIPNQRLLRSVSKYADRKSVV